MQLSILHLVVNEGKTPTIPENLSRDGQEFLKLCFERTPKRRANCERLLQHPFLQPMYSSLRPSDQQIPVPASHPAVNAIFSPIQEESLIAPSASLSGLRPKSAYFIVTFESSVHVIHRYRAATDMEHTHKMLDWWALSSDLRLSVPAAPDHRKLDRECVIAPALGPKSFEGNQPRPSAGPSAPTPLVHKRQFGSPVRPHMEASQATVVQQSRLSPQQAVYEPEPQPDCPSIRPVTATACLEQPAHVATPPVVEYPVVPDDPMMDESPESAASYIDESPFLL